jgi:Skp family chaperone for outer membrane proteins
LAIGLWTTSVQAQTAARPSGTAVAVIDLNEVLKAHQGLKTQLEQLKTQAEGVDAQMRQTKQKLESLAEELKTLNPGTADYAAKEKVLASTQADAAVQARQKSREFLEQQSHIHYEAYQEIQQHIDKFCRTYGIQLVLRFDRDRIDASKPQEVQAALLREVVYQDKLDITQHIIDSLSQGAGAPAPTNPGVTQRPPAIPRGAQR